MFTTTVRIGRLAVQTVLPAITVVAALRTASERSARPLPELGPRVLPMAEIQLAIVPDAKATTPVPALANGRVPSRISQADRPIGWEAMGEAYRRALEEAGATEPPPSSDVALAH